MRKATSQDELGYLEEGEPTDRQIELQDEIDNLITDFFNHMIEIYNQASDGNKDEFEHDIEKITEIREKTETLLELPDVY